MTEEDMNSNPEVNAETPEQQAIRFKDEEERLQKLLVEHNVSGNAADILIDQLARKHETERMTGKIISLEEFGEHEEMLQRKKKWEEENGTTISIEDFQELEYLSSPRKETATPGSREATDVRPPKTAEPSADIVHVSDGVTIPTEKLYEIVQEGIEQGIEAEHEARSASAEVTPTQKVRGFFDIIIDANEKKAKAEAELSGGDKKVWNGLVQGLQNLEREMAKLQKVNDSPAKEKELRTLSTRIADVERRKEQATAILANSQAAMKEAVGKAIALLGELPEDLRDAISASAHMTPEVDAVFAKYDLNPVAAQMLARAMEGSVEEAPNQKESIAIPAVPAPVGSGLYEIRDGHVYNQGTDERVDVEAPHTQIPSSDPSPIGKTTQPVASLVASADAGVVTYDRETDMDRIEELRALDRIRNAKKIPPITYPKVEVADNPALTGVYVEEKDGVKGVSKTDGKETLIPVPYSDLKEGNFAVDEVATPEMIKGFKEQGVFISPGTLAVDAIRKMRRVLGTRGTDKIRAINERNPKIVNINEEGPEERFKRMYGMAVSDSSAQDANTISPERPKFVADKDVSEEKKTPPSSTIEVVPPTPEVEKVEQPKFYITTNEGKEIPAQKGMVFVRPSATDEAFFDEVLNGKEGGTISLFRGVEGKTSRVKDLGDIQDGDNLYVVAQIHGRNKIIYVPATQVPERGVTLFDANSGEFGGAVSEIVTAEEKEKKKEEERLKSIAREKTPIRIPVTLSNRQLEDMEEQGVWGNSKDTNAETQFEIREGGKKNKWAILTEDAISAFQKSPTLTFLEVKQALGVGNKPTKLILESLRARGLIQFVEPETYTWRSSTATSPSASVAPVGNTTESMTPTAIATPEQAFSDYDKQLELQWQEAVARGITAPNWSTTPSTEEGVADGKKEKGATVELDEVGSLWASFIEREYGLDRDGDEIGTLGDVEIEKKSILIASLAEKPEVPTPTPETLDDERKEGKSVDAEVAKLFEAKFGVLGNELGELPVFANLAPAKQLLVLRNLEQMTLSDITKEARETQQKEWGNMKWWQRGLQNLLAVGMKPEHRIAELEKELLKKAQGTNDNRLDDLRRLAIKLGHIEELAKVAEQGPDVVVENGEMRINYVSKKDLFASLEDKKLSGEHLVALEEFNKTATAYAKVPHDWKQETATLGRGDQKLFERSERAYTDARATLMEVFAKKFADDGVAHPEERAMLQMNAIDERVALNQLFNTHPDAEKALQNISDTPAWKIAGKEFWKAKGLFVAYGALARGAVVGVAGALAVPTMGASLGALGLAPVVGYGVGHKIGKGQGEKLMKEKRVSGRMSEEEEREAIEYRVPVRNEKNEQMKDAEGAPLFETKTRTIKEFTDSTFFTDRLERLSLKLDVATSPEEKELLEKKIAQTTMLMAAKLRKGMINFGGSSLESDDERKGRVIANKLSFMQALHRAALTTMVDREKFSAEAERLTGIRLATIEEKRKEEIKKIAFVAGVWRGGLALTGAYLAQTFFPGSASPSRLQSAVSPSPKSPANEFFVPKAPLSDAERYALDPRESIDRTPKVEPKVEEHTPPPAKAVEDDVPPPHSREHRGEPEDDAPSPSQTEKQETKSGWTLEHPKNSNELPKPIEVAPNVPPPPPPSFLIPGGLGAAIGERGHAPMVESSGAMPPVQGAPRVGAESAVNSSAHAPEVARSIYAFESLTGRPLGEDEVIVIKNILQYESQASNVIEQSKIGALRRELATVMKTNGAPLSSSQINEILERNQFGGKISTLPSESDASPPKPVYSPK